MASDGAAVVPSGAGRTIGGKGRVASCCRHEKGHEPEWSASGDCALQTEDRATIGITERSTALNIVDRILILDIAMVMVITNCKSDRSSRFTLLPDPAPQEG